MAPFSTVQKVNLLIFYSSPTKMSLAFFAKTKLSIWQFGSEDFMNYSVFKVTD
jgi:hypothetical protein